MNAEILKQIIEEISSGKFVLPEKITNIKGWSGVIMTGQENHDKSPKGDL